MYSLNADAAQYPTPLSPEELSKVSQVNAFHIIRREEGDIELFVTLVPKVFG